MKRTERTRKARKPKTIIYSQRVREYLEELDRRRANGEYKLIKLGEWMKSGQAIATYDEKDLKYILR